MATRFRTYQYDWGFMTIDTREETAPEGYIAEFQVNIPEAELIQDGAEIEIVDNDLVITPAETIEEETE